MKVHAVIVAAGQGTRTGRALPKQFETLAGKPIFLWSVDAFLEHSTVSTVAVVLPAEEARSGLKALNDYDASILKVRGGNTRSESVLNGITALDAANDDIVLIHDAARPGIDSRMIDSLLTALTNADAAAPALPVSDALKHKNDKTLRDIPRDGLFRVQTPQAFRVGLIEKALSNLSGGHVDDLAAVESHGAHVELVRGNGKLHKITYEEDFDILEKLLTHSSQPEFRTGTGFDVHGFAEGDSVTLCGVSVPHTKALSGHSDADVGWHALTDAIFGALALGDLGDHFPPSDDKWKGASSDTFLRHAAHLAAEQGWAVTNADLTLICETPKIKPHRQQMQELTASILGVDTGRISIKATTTEGLGFTGRQEGIAAQAIVMLSR
ncbi:bifunctional 2-C-methyl-D-erythritol 4-phosphate cytidylyltransferase/2-C-methyl-D-erythritol 2,4-cyclodiphosphate synthase [Henriciella sp.]|uniref:bifunctional 2-C-methyl-D-erythritol 4-phosphate cytidylyltransferase/2-C-methyl-D-erythritol 2,4-cyclodiphosphate synthase n=1 Tax=Henriciella sp. TaxID=1968823 RepID=UPI00261B6AD4|nr:bifunctional 2-C-methyl-D-erythritol 4-phosphate cytidylyltransferase/2-C-methyl-D-erythritol 2,4-cyclodiphosphate synthase [Henriciella sp.]